MSAVTNSRRVNRWLSMKRLFQAVPGKAGDAIVMTTVDHTLMRGSEKPIFDRSPTGEYENIKMLIGWICPQTLDFVKNLSRVPTVLKQSPQA